MQNQSTTIQLSHLLVFTLFLITCQSSAPNLLTTSQLTVENFPNILNYKGVPDSTTDRSVYTFSDLGAWHGYALPSDNQLNGSFIGPFTMTQDNGIWLSKSLSKLDIINIENGQKIDLATAEIIENNSYPNQLQQTLKTTAPALLIQTTLIFVSNRTALVKIAIKNQSTIQQSLVLEWSGDSFLDAVKFTNQEEGVRINFGKNDNIGWISTPDKKAIAIAENEKNYRIQTTTKSLASQSNWTSYLSHTFCFSEKELAKEKANLGKILQDPTTAFVANKTRWNQHLQNSIANLKAPFNTIAHQKIGVKCLQTLHGNWRSAAGFLKHDGLFPSYNYEWFNGFWSWDSWKHAVAIAQFDTELAQNQIRAMYDFQDEMGMIADCVYRDTIIEVHNWRDTKPPLSAWSIWEVFQVSKDKAFLKELFPKVEKYHAWWYKYRDIDQNGLCEYGSTDASLIAAKWESGMDNAVRFDGAKIIPNALQGGSLDRESVDLNAYLFAEKEYLAKIALALEFPDKAEKYQQDADQLKTKIRNTFYDDESGWYYDVSLNSKEQLKVYGAEGWIPLWTKLATPEQAAKMRSIMLDTAKFATYIPFPTLAADHPKFKPKNGYWRGPVWLDQAYFAIQGLKNYGYEKEAIQFSHHLFDRLEGLKDDDLPIRENYHPLTGEGLESQHFSWSAAHLLMLLQADFTTRQPKNIATDNDIKTNTSFNIMQWNIRRSSIRM